MLRISFDFNETSRTVSNVKVEDCENKRARVITNSSPTDNYDDAPDLMVLDNKLQFSKMALAKLDIKPDDRVSIQYINEGIGKACPVIGKSQVFTDRLDGNRVTQKGTVSFRGEKRTTLIEFGTCFSLEEYKDNIWKLVSIENSEDDDNFAEELADAEALNNSEIEKEIEALTASDADDLPF